MYSVIAFPALAGMSYPRLEGLGLVRVVASPEEIPALPEADRADVRVLMTSATRGCSGEIADALPNLGFVVSQGVGQERIDLQALSKRKVQVRCVGEALTDDVADLAMAFTHMLCRNLVNADRFARSGEWRKERFVLGDSVVGMTMGIAGLSGRIGQAIAARATASRMKLAALDRQSNAGLGASLHDGWSALAAASDVLVLAVPASPGLRHVIGASQLEALGPKGRLVNVARGSLVDTDALIEALENRAIAGAALDVVEDEPNVPERLAALPNVILAPHIGAQTWGQRARGAAIAEDAVLSFLDGSLK
ncbi:MULTISPECIES: NAD(P)-dependent oxidoreductase [unclassified Mesorhizobium]|uniref:NAD(P)-dependent oxidoreductase n=1 Tax=Mesorhizobium TaxID=68287 RepID=UPI000FCB9191|nr:MULTISPECIES: NAD(P)-dependent oxidoreductase [unclassified Mesorhizobium]RUW78888.1 glyoxylate reductase [Mesorhizobium sp. M4B.F.Ca.ET.049.02.1.2]RVD30741.1 glyoxylate reductase [Mesorhizobium sp. M4B.F.Ca.ET.017.02.2.1]RWC97512.1 MAG: glyoxylate reductase [Mesorhizobium sp.]TGV26670.1 glyoxylate reductase [Mesorhizobium sp. M4B.F.Ca.ET.143.01.1.1]TIW75137.1 MAG: glyoxylate reductase [Mesorhizobium sp.]